MVAHFHYVLFGTIVFAVFAGIYFWFPKFTGRYLDERLGKLHFWLTFIGFHMTFLVQHWLGAEGMPRRYADYLPSDGFTTLNTVSTIGAFLLGVVDAAVPVERLPVVPVRRGRHRRRPVGPRQLAGVGDVLPAAAAQLHRRCRGSARSGRRSRRTTRTWPTGSSWRRTPAGGPVGPGNLVGAEVRPAAGREGPRPDLTSHPHHTSGSL